MFGRKTMTCAMAGLMLGAGSYALAANGADGEKPRQDRQQKQDQERQRDGEKQRQDQQAQGDQAPGPRADMPEPGQVLGRLLRGLKITDAQEPQIKEAGKAFADKVKAFRDEHKDEIEALRKELQEARDAKDREKAQAVLEKIKALHEKAPKLEELLTDVRVVLDDTQREEFDARVAKMKEEIKQRVEDRRNGDGPKGDAKGDGPKNDRQQKRDQEQKKDGEQKGDNAGDAQMDI